MKSIQFPIELIEGVYKYCKLNEIRIIEKVVDNLQQSAYVTLLLDTSKSDGPHNNILIHNDWIISLFGVVKNDRVAASNLKKLIDQDVKNGSSHLTGILTVLNPNAA